MRSHLRHDGQWDPCAIGTDCLSPFHLDMLAAEITALPMKFLLPLLEAFDPPSVVERDGTKVWYNTYRTEHRGYDLPAVVSPNGDMSWFFDGLRHRDHGRPAVLCCDGKQEWWRAGRLHREGAAAIRFSDGSEEWYLRGRRVGVPASWVTQ